MKRTIIGIVGRSGMNDNRPVMFIDENFRRLVYNNGAIPLLILPSQDIEYKLTESKDMKLLTIEEKQEIMDLVDMCDGIIMPGGNRQYEYDKFIYKYALSKNIPIMGICLGMQLMCNVDNEQIVANDKPIRNDSYIEHNQPDNLYAHKIKINKNSKLFDIINEEEILVNSFHNYHIEKVNSLIVTARSSDNYIEAVEMPNKRFVVGLQWHPEKKLEENELNQKIIREFIRTAKEVSNARSIKENI